MRGLSVAGVFLLVTVLAEIAVLALAIRWIGVGWTVLLVLATSVLGGWLLRREGVRAWRRFREAAQAGRAPGVEASNGVLGLIGAILLILPGFLTDLAGLALLLPFVRRLARGRLQALAERRVSPALAADLFGPRRVRVRRGQPAGTDGRGAGHPAGPPSAAGDGPRPGPDGGPAKPEGPIEGEIIDPPH
ncbi:MAG: FxsA family protein [Micromonosporaceae bacterium]|nr:FxsA family protein [Micromonosporaceae bacterium]